MTRSGAASRASISCCRRCCGSHIDHAARSTLEAALTSAWRSRRRPLPQAAASELIRIFDQRHQTADNGSLATEYWHAMPHAPPKIDRKRQRTYERLRRSAGAAARRRDCKPSGAKRPRRC